MKGTIVVNSDCGTGELLWKITDRLRSSQLSHSEKSTRINATKKAILETVFTHSEGIMLKDLAREVDKTSGAVSQMIDLLVRDKLVTRTIAPHDRRAVAIRLTPLGQARRREYVAELNRAADAVLQTVDAGTRRAFDEILGTVAARIQ